MIKKIAIGLAVLLVALVALYTLLNVLYNNNSRPAAALADMIESRARNYYSAVQSGTFDYDTERSVLNEYIRDYNELNNWFIRPSVVERYEAAVIEAERELESARDFQSSAEETQAASEEAARRAFGEILERAPVGPCTVNRLVAVGLVRCI